MDDLTQLLDKFPFITYLVYGGNDFIGIIQNSDEQITTLYDFGGLKTPEQKQRFLDLGEQWWWESNRLIPINVFLRDDWRAFKAVLRTLNSKDVVIKCGPSVNLRSIAVTRSKRRSITLVRKLD